MALRERKHGFRGGAEYGGTAAAWQDCDGDEKGAGEGGEWLAEKFEKANELP